MQDAIERLRRNISSVYLGNPEAVDRAVCCLLARGHLLIEDVPGVGKTVLAMALARSIDCSFARIQFTPDLLPGDVVGVSVFDRTTGGFELRRGPIFANVVLADEINRASPRTQSATLEAMSEGSVSIDGVTHALDRPFMVIATQNPLDFEGVYPLPENQLDRFLMRIGLGYPTPEVEARLLHERPSEAPLHTLRPALSREEVLELQRRVDAVRLDASLTRYIVAFAGSTRTSAELQIGLSPRGALALAQAARATALMAGRDYCIPEDVTGAILPVCSHRVAPVSRTADGDGPAAAIRRIVEGVRSPA